jgi:hypothetical protein
VLPPDGYLSAVADLAGTRVLPELGKAAWSPGRLLDFEIALEGIRQAIGFCAQRIAAEADPAVIAELRAEQAVWAARGRDLTPADAAAIERIRDDAGDLLGVEDDEDEDDEQSD